MQIQDKSFLVTGGGSGLGLAAARRLVDGGARVLVADLSETAGEAAVAALGPRAVFVRTDVGDAASGAAAVAAAVERFGALHGLVNCAGIGPAEKVLGRDGPQPLDHFARVLQVNLLGSFNMLRLAAHAMAGNAPGPDGERGVIVNTASVAAFDGQIGQAAYSASKGGIVGMTLPIARELARAGIRVMTIAPGIMATPMLQAMPQEVQEALNRSVPFPARLGDPDEFARLVLHIVDNAYLNGEVIRLDGAIRMAPR
jgi:NAD(P)-dependent dehydrogenase (short-subunit alcohol dehydrogenase family)